MHKAVIGIGFGDEGKGRIIDLLASHLPSPSKSALNVRFSGGHQVGHTVRAEYGTRHVFSNFGSATMRGVPTYWSKDCTVCPTGLLNELDILREKGFEPKIYIHAECPIVTPMDQDANRSRERDNNHGSVGVGFGSTVQREEDFYSLKFIDLFYPDVLNAKTHNICMNYYKPEEFDFQEFWDACRQLCIDKAVEIVHEMPYADNVLFEGSQGMLLDQHYGFFPNVTRSNTGSKNLADYPLEIEWYLVTRAYQTRHGNGFMTNESTDHNIKQNPEETNVTNDWQGEFRRSLLDVSLLEYGIRRDEIIRKAKMKRLVITCVDHVVEDGYRFTYHGELFCCVDEHDFANQIGALLGIQKVYLSNSDNGEWREADEC